MPAFLGRSTTDTLHSKELDKGRFAFGDNWSKYLHLLNDQRINDAQKSLTAMLDTPSLAGKSFLDIGSGSGLPPGSTRA